MDPDPSQKLPLVATRPGCLRLLKGLVEDRSGSALVEFSLVAPILMLLWVGAMQFALFLRQEIILQNAVHQGAQILAGSGASAGRTDPNVYSDALNAVNIYSDALNALNVAWGLVPSSLTVSMSVCNAGGSSCSACGASGLGSCANLLQSATGDAVQVSASYPCAVMTYALFSLSPTCTLSASESALVE